MQVWKLHVYSHGLHMAVDIYVDATLPRVGEGGDLGASRTP